jgi:hypothetical protein
MAGRILTAGKGHTTRKAMYITITDYARTLMAPSRA